MSTVKNVILYFPFRKSGGVSILFINLSQVLKANFNVYLVDFFDGFMARNLPGGVNLIDVETVEQYPEDSIVIFQSFSLWNVMDIEKFNGSTKILFWNLHPDNLHPYIFSTISSSFTKNLIANLLLPLSVFRRRKLTQLVTYLLSTNGIVFMDGENCESTQRYLGLQNHPCQYLPVFTFPTIKANTKKVRLINFAWIGRICDFKIHILIHLLERLDNLYDSNTRINFLIIGDGDEMDYLKENLNKYTNLAFRLVGEVSKEEESKLLYSGVDVLFAMGMSALEGASRGIPTVLLDYSYKPIEKQYKFKLAYENVNFNLGREIKEEHYELDSTLQETLSFIETNYEQVSLSCLNWWERNYSPQVVYKMVIAIIENDKAIIQDLCRRGFNKPDKISVIVRYISGLLVKPPAMRSYFKQI